jgi:hypothetical protein
MQTGKTAIKELLSEVVIERIGEGNVGSPYRYFTAATRKALTAFGVPTKTLVG